MFDINGFRVEFYHVKVTNPTYDLFPHGISHITDCAIFPDTIAEDEKVHKGPVQNLAFTFGSAFCSVEDNFNKAIGRKLALTRALEGSKFSKEERTAIWETYFDIVKKA